jgi:hypothetical protein
MRLVWWSAHVNLLQMINNLAGSSKEKEEEEERLLHCAWHLGSLFHV